MSRSRPRYILACDGGGIRALATLQFLLHLERTVRSQYDPTFRVCEFFDVFAGTSAGGMLLGLAVYKALGMQELMAVYGPSYLAPIFRKTWRDRLFGIMQRRPKYDGVAKREMLRRALGQTPFQGGGPLAKKVIIPVYNLTHKAQVLVSDHKDAPFSAAEVLDATSAAPAYFPPVRMGDGYYMDGAIFANNPSMCALVEALITKTEDEGKCDPRPTVVLSIGTGFVRRSLNGARAVRYGGLQWLRHDILGLPFEESEIDLQVQQLADSYLRVNGELPEGVSEDLDNSRPQNMAALQAMGTSWWKEYETQTLRLLGFPVRRVRTG